MPQAATIVKAIDGPKIDGRGVGRENSSSTTLTKCFFLSFLKEGRAGVLLDIK
ncbi:hypothetical protein ES703_10658 [subsurface metagenome]